MLSSRFSLSIRASSSSSSAFSGRAYSYEVNAHTPQAFFLLFTYILDAGLSPTMITASPGARTPAGRLFTFSAVLSRRISDIFFPSIIFADIKSVPSESFSCVYIIVSLCRESQVFCLNEFFLCSVFLLLI